MKNVLSIAGVDPSGGAGLIADIKVFIAHGVYAMGVVTATTAQNTKGLFGMQLIDTKMISDGIDAIFDDIKVSAVKIGVVPSVEIIKTVASALKKVPNLPPVVLDPVMSCKNGDIWLEGESKEAIVKELFPLATLITPNKFEAQEILGKKLESKVDFEYACKELLKLSCKSVYLKAGKFKGKSLDIFYDGDEFVYIENERIDTDSTHGSGCSLSSAIASNLANGKDAKTAVLEANNYIFNAIKSAYKIGYGCNPVNHFHKFY